MRKEEEAHKQPLTEEGIRKQMGKCGNTAFYLDHLDIRMPGDVFLPVKTLNDLRRTALERLEEEIIKKNGWAFPHGRKTEEQERKKGTHGKWGDDE